MVPRLVVKVTCVPEWGGTPAASITTARICVVPLIGNAVALDVSVMIEPDGARSGTFWQLAAMAAEPRIAAKPAARRKRGSMKALSILIPMQLRGQAGYAMAVLLVAMSIMAVMLTVAMPVWKQASQREKEEELVFRGTQYARAIGLFQRKYANAYPPTIDVLVTERFLRRKYKDPITNDDFALILAGQNTTGTQQPPAGGRGTQQPMASSGATGAGTTQPSANPIGGPAQNPSGGRGGTPVGGIMGVTSKSKAESIRL